MYNMIVIIITQINNNNKKNEVRIVVILKRFYECALKTSKKLSEINASKNHKFYNLKFLC